MSPNNDTISLCGHRDGLAIKLRGYQDRLGYFSFALQIFASRNFEVGKSFGKSKEFIDLPTLFLPTAIFAPSGGKLDTPSFQYTRF